MGPHCWRVPRDGAGGGGSEPPSPHAQAARRAQGNPGSQPHAKWHRLVLTAASRRTESASVPTHSMPPQAPKHCPVQPRGPWDRAGKDKPRYPKTSL